MINILIGIGVGILISIIWFVWLVRYRLPELFGGE